MSESPVNVGPIACQLSNLTVFTANAQTAFSETVLQGYQPFSLKVTVEFSGSGAIALMPLSPAIQVKFFTKPLSPEQGIVLGSVEVMTRPGILSYTPTLNLGPPLSIGLRTGTIYRIGAVLRVGAPDWPALITGFTEELTIEVYIPPDSRQPESS
jgi:hypothetical protein